MLGAPWTSAAITFIFPTARSTAAQIAITRANTASRAPTGAKKDAALSGGSAKLARIPLVRAGTAIAASSPPTMQANSVMAPYRSRYSRAMVRLGMPIAFIAPISWMSSSKVPRITKRTFSSAMAMSSRLAKTKAIATSPSLNMLTSRIITSVTAWPFFGTSGSDS